MALLGASLVWAFSSPRGFLTVPERVSEGPGPPVEPGPSRGPSVLAKYGILACLPFCFVLDFELPQALLFCSHVGYFLGNHAPLLLPCRVSLVTFQGPLSCLVSLRESGVPAWRWWDHPGWLRSLHDAVTRAFPGCVFCHTSTTRIQARRPGLNSALLRALQWFCGLFLYGPDLAA